MAVTITLDSVNGESTSTVGDKVRALPANQGLNEFEMKTLIDTEIASVVAAQPTKFRKTYHFDAAGNYLSPKGKK